MNKLKLIGGALAVVAGVQIVGAKIVGANLENRVKTATDAFSDVMGYPFAVEGFHQGWFSSDMTIRVPFAKILQGPLADVGITPHGLDGAVPYFDLDIHLVHGPIIYKHGFHFGLAYAEAQTGLHATKKAAALIHEQNPEKRELYSLFVADLIRAVGPDITLDAHYDGSVDLTARLHGGKAALRQQAEGGAEATSLSLNLKSATSSFHLSGNAQTLSGNTRFGGMTLDLAAPGIKTYIETGAMTISGDYKPVAPALWAGNAHFASEPVRVTLHHDGKPVIVQVRGIKMENKSEIGKAGNAGVLSGSTEANIDRVSVQVDDNVLSLNDIDMVAGVKNLLVDLMAREMQMRKDLAKRGEIQDPNKPFAAVDAPDFASLAERQIEAHPSLSIDHLTVANVDGQVGLAGGIGLKDTTDASVLQKPEALAGALDGSFTVTIEPGMLKTLMYQVSSLGPKKMPEDQSDQMVDAMLKQYSQQGLIKADGDKYVSTLEIKDNTLIVNGRPLRPLYMPMPAPAPVSKDVAVPAGGGAPH